jgi:hypothetical protein
LTNDPPIYQGARHTVTAVPGGYVWRESTYASLTTIAWAITGTGPRFFGLRTRRDDSEVLAQTCGRVAAAHRRQPGEFGGVDAQGLPYC